jgi:predicted enzyme related to lactoylglutathione lyase
MANPVTHFEILGQDGKRAQDFYASLFGWTVDASNPMQYGLVAPPDGRGIGGGIAASQDGKPTVTVYVEVDDLDATLRQAESLGGKIVAPPMDVPGGPTIAQFSDPDGNIIGLTKSGTM